MSIREKITEIKKLFQKNGAKKVDRNFEKGLAIIVGKKTKSGHIHTDAISLHTGYYLGYRVEFLEEANISSKDKQIYLIGHGHPKKLTIGGRNMEEIAKLLIKKGYNGNQRIYVTSCYAALQRGKTSVVSELKNCLAGELSDNTSNNITTTPNNLNIESDADGAAVYVEKDSNVEMWIIPPDKSTILDTCTQSSFIFANGYIYKKLPSNFKNLIGNVNNFKKGLINSKRKRRVFMDIDGSAYYGEITTLLFAPLFSEITNLTLLVYNVIIRRITISQLEEIIILDAILCSIFLGIQKLIKYKGLLFLILYKGLGINFILRLIVLFLTKFIITDLANVLLCVTWISPIIWITTWVVVYKIKMYIK